MCKFPCLTFCRTSTNQNKYLYWHKGMFLNRVLHHFTIDLLLLNIFTIILAFIFICKFADSMFKIVFEVTFISISICINIFSFSLPDTVDVISIILITIGILSISLTSIISRRVASFTTFWCELIWSSTLLIGHFYLN